MSDKKFYVTEYKVLVYSDTPYDKDKENDLDVIAYDINDGDCVGKVEQVSSKEVSSGEMIELLEAAGSDASFFDIDDLPECPHCEGDRREPGGPEGALCHICEGKGRVTVEKAKKYEEDNKG